MKIKEAFVLAAVTSLVMMEAVPALAAEGAYPSKPVTLI